MRGQYSDCLSHLHMLSVWCRRAASLQFSPETTIRATSTQSLLLLLLLLIIIIIIINRLLKPCCFKYYTSKVENTRNHKPLTRWKDLKTLFRIQSATRTDPKFLLKHILPGPISWPTTLADTISDSLLAPLIYTFSPRCFSRCALPQSTLSDWVIKKLCFRNFHH